MEDSSKIRVCPCCKGQEFYAHQVLRADIVVDADNVFLDNARESLEKSVYDAGEPYGPYTCTDCGCEVSEIEDLELIEESEMEHIHRKTVSVKPELALHIRKLLMTQPKSEEEGFGEDETFSLSASFENNIEMDVKLCGVRFEEGEDNRPWTEAVLFERGAEIQRSDPEDRYFGAWTMVHNGETYVVVVK